MGTALTRAQEYLDAVVALAEPAPYELPTKQLAALGSAVADCESVVITATSVNPHTDENNSDGGIFRCAPPQIVTLTGFIARECEGGYDGEGFTNVSEYEDASAKAQTDLDLLWEAVFSMQAFLGPSDISGSWAIDGGIWMASIQFSIGVL